MKQKQQTAQEQSKHGREAPKGRRGTTQPAPTPSTERRIDESLDESFPASDPPAHSTVSHPPAKDLIERGED